MKRFVNQKICFLFSFILIVFMFAGCGGGGGTGHWLAGSEDVTAPTVTSVAPLNNATNVAINTKVSATFSEAMNPATITATTFTLKQGATAVAGTVAYFGLTAVFTTAANLANNTIYTATITTGAKDIVGNALAASKVWTFTTGVAADTTAPMVMLTVPANGDIGVLTNAKTSATFSEPMDPATISTTTFTLKQGTTVVAGAVTYSGVTAVFTPASNLTASTLYTATITTGAKDLAGNALAASKVWTFTTGAAADTTSPMVTSVVPINNSVGVALNTSVSAIFNETMDPITINTTTFTLMKGTTAVSGTVSYSGVTAVFMPDSALTASTLYTATITTGAMDLAGNALAVAKTWTFTTGAAPDATRPAVTSVVPVNSASGVALNTSVTAIFSEAMDPVTITTTTFTLMKGATPVSGTVTYSGVTAVFTPDSNLSASTIYTATITTGARDLAKEKNLDRNQLGGNQGIPPAASSYVWTFTTGAAADTTRPTVISVVPANNATGIALNSSVTAIFSEAMNPAVTSTFTLKQGATDVSGTVDYSGVTAVFTPDSALTASTIYTATISTAAMDLAGNTLAVAKVWSFTTGAAADSTRPTVTSVVPANNATGIALNSSVTAIFSEEMNPAVTSTFTLKQGTTVVPGAVTYSGVTAIFTPDSNLAASAIYTATISTAAMDLAGNTLAAAKVWSFTTGAAPDTTRPTVTSVVPLSNATGVALNSSVTAIFSEEMNPAVTSTFTLKQGATIVSGSVGYSGVTAIFTPDSNLAASTIYTATISTAAMDLAGNTLAVAKVWSFTTGAAPDATRPTVTITNPDDGDMSVALNKTISVSFSEPMDPLSVTTTSFTLKRGVTSVSGTVNYVGATATFTPDVNLLPSTLYTATITTVAKDLAGNQLDGNQGVAPDDYVWTFTTGTGVAQTVLQTPVDLGSSSNFAILASAAITNIPTSIITGDIGLHPDAGSKVSGFSVPATCPEVNGLVYVVDASGPACATIDPVLLLAAKSDAALAFTNARAAVRGTPTAMSGNINGLTLYPGLYESGTSIEISPGGIVYLDAQGDSSAIFIIRSATTITTSSTSQVILTKGAKANNVYWTAGSSVTLGTNSTMKGTLIAGTGISLLTGANLEGRALNQGASAAAITLDSSTITVPTP